MKYMIICPSLTNGGAERVVSVLASKLAQMGKDITLILYYRNEKEYPLDPNVQVRCLSNGTEKNYQSMRYFQKVVALRKIFKEESPDVVVPFLWHVGRLAQISSLGLPCKVIQTIRADPESSPPSRIHRTVRDFLVFLSWRTIVQCEAQKHYFAKSVQKKIFVMLNPVSENFVNIEHAPSKDFVIVSAGRLEAQKNYSMLIRAVHRLHESDPAVQLKIYGCGALQEELQSLVVSLGEQNLIQLMGRSESIEQVYKSANAFVLSSNFEGLPNALMEAMAAGVPCVSTDCRTGPSELIENGVNGLLIPVGDETALLKAIQGIYIDPQRSAEMGRQAKRFIRENCDEKRVAERFEAICSNLAKE